MRSILLILCTVCCFSYKLKACHGVSLVNVSYTISATGITISGASGPATCGCGPYWMQAQVSTSPALSTTPDASVQATLAGWPCTGGGTSFNSYPWYNSALNLPDLCADQCALEPYNDVYIPFSSLPCGGVYYFAVREWVSGSSAAGPWTAVTSFTVPPKPAADLSFSLAALNHTICQYDSTTLSAANIINGPITDYSWSGGGTTSTVNVSPNSTTTYSLIATNANSCTYMDTVTIFVKPATDPAFTPSDTVICKGNTIMFNAVESGSLISHYWDLSPDTGYTVNNSTVTPVPDITFNASGNYVTTHTVVSNGCSYTSTTSVLVQPAADPAFTPSDTVICMGNGNAVMFNAVESGSLVSHYWDLSPNTGYTVNNSTVTAVLDITFNASGNYVTTHTVVSNGCSYTSTTSVLVQPAADPAFTPSDPIICMWDNVVFNAVESGSLTSHYWDISPNTGYTVNNSTVTPTPDITFNVSGNYVTTHTIVSNGCSYTSTTSVLVNVCTSVKEIPENMFSIYPNPSTGSFHLNYKPDLKGKITVEIYDLLGKTVFVKNNFSETEIQFTTIAGVYMIKVTAENKKPYFKRLVVE